MLELADRYDSGSYVGNDVRVQVPYSASHKEGRGFMTSIFFILKKEVMHSASPLFSILELMSIFERNHSKWWNIDFDGLVFAIP